MKQYKIWHPVMNRFVTDECYIRASDGELFSYEADYGGTFSSHEKLEKVNGVLVRWTGCYDKNRTPIYEGDIIKLFNGDLYTVKFIEENNETEMSGYFFSSFGSEVIGNIFENPELLKQ